MAGAAIGKFGALLEQHRRHGRIVIRIVLEIIFRLRSVTSQTPTHIQHLRVLLHRHLGHVAMTIFAVQPGRDVRSMIEVNEIRHVRHGHPLDRLAFHDVIAQLDQLRPFLPIRFGLDAANCW